MENRVLLINPAGFNSGWIPSAGLFYIAANLRKHDYRVRVLDCNFTAQDIPAVMAEENPDIVGISCFSCGYSRALGIARLTKEISGAVTVLGGVHISMTKGQALANRSVDFTIAEEGEDSFLRLVEAINNNHGFEDIPGLCFRKNAGIAINDAVHIPDLDDLPFPDYRLGNIGKLLSYPLVTSRGCPHSCVFCCECRSTNRKWRSRSAENIIDEIVYAQKTYSPAKFEVIDDNFSLDINRVKEFCSGLINKRINIAWSVSTGMRADKADRELFALMKRAGCSMVTFGIESADEEVFKGLNKGESLEDIRKAVRWAKEAGIEVVGFFIIGLPGSTFSSEKKSLFFFREFRLSSATYSIACPFQGTPLYDWVKAQATILKDAVDDRFALDLGIEPFFETTSFRRKEIRKAFVFCNLRIKKYFIKKGAVGYFRAFAKVVGLSLRYDPVYLPVHIAYFVRLFFKKLARRLSKSCYLMAQLLNPLARIPRVMLVEFQKRR